MSALPAEASIDAVVPEPVSSVVIRGDCLDVMRGLLADGKRFHAVITDPPYGLSAHGDIAPVLSAWLSAETAPVPKKGFMGAEWDGFVPGPEYWRLCLDLLLPGGHLVAFAGSRTSDLMSIALRLAGFEIRDVVQYLWTYSTGMPKGLNVAKAVEALTRHGRTGSRALHREQRERSAAEPEAECLAGWNTSLKPSYEPIILARKPLDGTVAENVLAHGTGALNVGACRVPLSGPSDAAAFSYNHDGANRSLKDDGASAGCLGGGWKVVKGPKDVPEGRWPSNLCHDGSAEALALFEAFGERPGALARTRSDGAPMGNSVYGAMRHPTRVMEPRGDQGSAARFYPSLGADDEDLEAAALFYSGKASRKDRDEDLAERNPHVCVKPTELMRWLCRLVTPLGGRILDPFCGSGSTGKAAALEGFEFLGIERDEDYARVARKRIEGAARRVGASR
jgi:DNA modification methylase